MDQNTDKFRLDKWLWAARFFKTRALASAAVASAKVLANGQRVKSSRPVKIGEIYEIRRGEERFEITVTGLSGRRGNATSAQTLYEELQSSIELRRLMAEQRKISAMQHPHSERRPNKQERRKIRQFSGKD